MNRLNLNKRDTSIPNNAKKLRREGKVPGILYGNNILSVARNAHIMNNIIFNLYESMTRLN